jgi:hypothetical protein
MFVPGAPVVVLGTPGDASTWLERLADLYARGGQIEVDIRRLETVVPDGRDVLAQFAADMAVRGAPPMTQGRAGRLQVRFARPRDEEAPGPSARWLVSGVAYVR